MADLSAVTVGTPGDDAFTAASGDATFVGGAGVDRVTFGFRLIDAQVTFVADRILVVGPTGRTLLSGIERFHFADGLVDGADGGPLVDDLFYYARNPDVWRAGVDADTHYATFGWREGRDPNPFFSTFGYLDTYPDVAAAGVNPIVHYDTFGPREGRNPQATFDTRAYLAANPDVAAAGVDPLAHFLQFGRQEGRQPIPTPAALTAPNGFDYAFYLARNPDVAAAGIDPATHFNLFGWREGRDPNAYFDTKGYLATYRDVAAAGVNPLEHFDTSGWREGRISTPAFDGQAYLAANPDVAAAGIDPLRHYLAFGIAEGRAAPATPVRDADGAANHVSENAAAGTPVGVTLSWGGWTSPNLTYSLVEDGSGGGFQVDALTGQVTVLDGSRLDVDGAGRPRAYTVTVRAQNEGFSATQSVAIAIDDVNDSAPVFTSASSISVAENATAVVSLTASDRDTVGTNPPVFSVTGGADAALFRITGGNQLAFIGPRDYETQAKSYAVQVAANDGANVTRQDITVTLTDLNDTAPAFTSASTVGVAENTTAVVTLTTSDPDTVGTNPPVFSVTGGADGALFRITGGNQLAFIGPRDYETPARSYAVQVGANDGANVTVQNLTVTLTDVNDNAPVFTSPPGASTPEGVATSAVVYTASAQDADGAGRNSSILYSLDGPDAALFAIDAVTGAVTFRASPDFESPTDADRDGIYTFAVTAADRGSPALSTTQVVNLTVTDLAPSVPVDGDPTANSVVNRAAAGTAVGITARSTDPNGPAVSYAITADSSNGGFAVDPSTGIVTVADPAKVTYAGSGPDHAYVLTLAASDGTLSSAETFTIAVTPGNSAPRANPDSYTTAEDTVLIIPGISGLLVNDTDADADPLTAAVVTGPTHGTLTLNPNGSFNYTPALNYNGADSFTYRANDGSADSNPTSVTINVTPVNDAPVARPDMYVTNAGQPFPFTEASLLSNDEDADGDVLRVTNLMQPPNGMVMDSGGGNYIYTPRPGFSGVDMFTYTATDGTDTSTTTVTIFVNGPPPNGQPSASAATGNAVSESGLDIARGALVTGSQPTTAPDTTSGTLGYDFGPDGANASSPFTWSTIVVASDAESGDPALPRLTSGGDDVQWSVGGGSNGRVLLGTAVGTGPYDGLVVARLELTDLNTGSYAFTLLGPIDHPDANQSGAADPIALQFDYTVRDATNDAATGSLTVNVQDDAPVANDVTKTGSSSSQADTNLLVILDVGGGMADPSGFTNLRRAELARAAILELFEQYDNLGTVAVRIVLFNQSARSNGTFWTTIDQAKTYLESNSSASGGSDYDAALAQAQTAFASSGSIPGANNVAYFISNGTPSSPIDALDQASWESFLGANSITSYAIGPGMGLSPTQLDPIAYDGTTSTQISSVLLTNLSQLDATVTRTTAAPIVGNIVADAADSFGADQSGFVKSIVLDGTTYTYNANANTVTATGGADHGVFNSTTHIETVTTALGGSFTINVLTSDYTYDSADGVSQPITESISYRLSDHDGDVTGGNALTLNVATTSIPPMARDDRVLTNAYGAGVSITIPDAALLFNDDGKGSSLTLTGPTNVSGGAADHTGSQFTFTDDDDYGGRFRYAAQASNGTSDAGLVTIGTQHEGPSLAGTGLADILIGNPSAGSIISGYEGNDYLIGGSQDDTILGGAGNDVLQGGYGYDKLTGDAGKDVFLFTSSDIDNAVDQVYGFAIGSGANGDVLKFSQVLTGASSASTAADLSRYLAFERGTTTVLEIDTNMDSSVDQTVIFEGTDLYSQYGVSPGANANVELIQQMLTQQNLLIV